ncbi:acetyl-CoA carboxylase biotin carboxyl carrier protein [Burkholderiales bacterium]|nr:acetyl-CoA carboxylase biotin carboxyl carrier protein [Burkholderiales bacterium]
MVHDVALAGPHVDLRELEQLFDMIRGSGIAVLEIEDPTRRIRVKCAPAGETGAQRPNAPRVASAVPSTPVASHPVVDPQAPATETRPARHVVRSSLVGTIHRAVAPGTRPFVDVGDAVEAGCTLCVIEAMKLRKEIHADRAGVVTEVLVDSGQPVEYGQPLFVIA